MLIQNLLFLTAPHKQDNIAYGQLLVLIADCNRVNIFQNLGTIAVTKVSPGVTLLNIFDSYNQDGKE